MKTGILLICVGKYDQFLHGMLNSIEKYWTHDKEIFLFTDKPTDHKGVTQFGIPYQKFPSCSLFRYHYFNQVKDYFEDCDYLYYVDVDARFVDYVGDEILDNDLIAVKHCGYYKSGGGSFENNKDSCFYIGNGIMNTYQSIEQPFGGINEWDYVGGGFQGGRTKHYTQAWGVLIPKIDEDIRNDIIPRHHDETAWNWYWNWRTQLMDITKGLLNPAYHYTESAEKAKLWGIENIKPKLLLLEKDHAKIR